MVSPVRNRCPTNAPVDGGPATIATPRLDKALPIASILTPTVTNVGADTAGSTLPRSIGCDELLIPIQAEYYALEGVSQLLETVEMVKTHLNPELRISTVLPASLRSRSIRCWAHADTSAATWICPTSS